jgi:eukaryotic-like serine/threonine-protein kinase
MADIFVARDLRKNAPVRVVALKIVRDELLKADAAYLDLFKEEVNVLIRLKHPNLIQLLDTGSDGGRHFIAMELLLGRTLADVFDLLAERGERMPAKLSAWVCARVAFGLHHAHELKDEQGRNFELIHRDVNPSNIFLTFDGRVKLIDFGLARSRGAVAETGMVKGKIAYLAPEQITGRAADRRADIFQLGITFWELLTGTRLFKRDSHTASIHAIRDDRIAAPNTVAHDVPRELSAVAMRSLAYDPDRRFTTMSGFGRALDAGARGSPELLSAYLEQVFPGQRADVDRWYAEVTGQNPKKPSTLYPPTSIPSVHEAAAAQAPTKMDDATAIEASAHADREASSPSGTDLKAPTTTPPPQSPEAGLGGLRTLLGHFWRRRP